MSTDEEFSSSPGPGQGILSLTERGWPAHKLPHRDESTLVLEVLERVARALYRAHQALAPHLESGSGPVSPVWALGLELAINQAANLLPAHRHHAMFDEHRLDGTRLSETGSDAPRSDVDAAGPTSSAPDEAHDLDHVERLLLEAEEALRAFPFWQGPAGAAELGRVVLDLLGDLSAARLRVEQRGGQG